MRPHRRQPTRLPRPWDSPGKNTGVGCHFLLQCMKVESESEVAQSCLTLSDPMDCSLPGSSIHGIFPGNSTGVGCHCFLSLMLPTQFMCKWGRPMAQKPELFAQCISEDHLQDEWIKSFPTQFLPFPSLFRSYSIIPCTGWPWLAREMPKRHLLTEWISKEKKRTSLVVQRLRQGFSPCSGRIPHASEQPSPCTTTTEPHTP